MQYSSINNYLGIIALLHKEFGLNNPLTDNWVFQSLLKRMKHVKGRRETGIIRYLSKYVSRDPDVLDQICKLYVRPQVHYDDIIYHKYDPEYTLELIKRLESTQYSAALAVSSYWRGTNTDRLLEELGWEYLYHRRWYRRLCHFYKLRNTQSPGYLFQHIPTECVINYNLRNLDVLKQSVERTSRYFHTYFQNCIKERNLLDIYIYQKFDYAIIV